jgi:hypothetical protein
MGFAALLLLLLGCPAGPGHVYRHPDHSDGDGHHGGGGDVEVPTTYVAAIAKIKELSATIDGLIAEGKLTSVHPPAADIKKIAQALAKLADKDLPKESLRDVNVKATELAGMFTKIDQVADASKKKETIAVHDQMKELIATLEAYGTAQPTQEDTHDH